jgi:subtilisin family serine protease
MIIKSLKLVFCFICLVLLLACSNLSPAFFEGPQEIPKQMVDRQLLVTLPESLKSDWPRIREELAQKNDILVSGEFPLTSIGVNCLVFKVPEQENFHLKIQQLQADSRVQLVQVNQVFEGIQSGLNDPLATISYAPQLLHVDLAHAMATGKGVRLAVIDTGVETDHPDLKNQFLETANFVDGSAYTFRHDRHGTAVTGVIAAKADDGIGIYGIAPDSEVNVFKACWYPEPSDAKAQCSTWSLAKAVDAAIKKKVRIINLSLAGPPDALLSKLLETAHQKGITVVAATLEKKGQPGFPADLPWAIPVISSGPYGQVLQPKWLKDFPQVVAAPGIEILTTVPNDGYDFVSGSSLAAAHVSGIIALLLELNSRLLPEQIKDLLLLNGRESSTRTLKTLDALAILKSLNTKARP